MKQQASCFFIDFFTEVNVIILISLRLEVNFDMKNYKKILVVSAIGLTLCSGAVVSLAYNTDSGSLLNNITVARTDISVVEENYDNLPDANNNGIKDPAENIVQGKTITKDPAVLNSSTLDMYCFMSVEIPVKTVMTVERAPQRVKTQLFSYQINGGWQELSRGDTSGGVRILYGYTSKVAPNAKTARLFNSVKYANVVEGEIPASPTLDINITGYGIQAVGFSSMQDAYNSFDWNQASMLGR